MAITNNPTSSKMEFFTGSHCFTIIGYSRIDVSGISAPVKSKTFFIGGYEWCLIFCPKGNNTNDDDDHYISIYPELVNETARVKALYRIDLLGSNGKPSTVNYKSKEASIFEGSKSDSSCGTRKFVGKKDLDALGFLKEDSLTLKCTVLVIKESQNIESSSSSPSSSSATLIPSRPTNTSSIMEFHHGVHHHKVAGYSSSHGLGTGMLIRDAFEICGYNWCLKYYPNGTEKNDNDQNISCFLDLVGATDDVKVLFELAFLDLNGKSSATTPKCKGTSIFNKTDDGWGYATFMNKNVLEASDFLKDDSFTIKCSIVIVKEPEALLGTSST